MGQNDLSCIGPSLWNNLRGSLKKKNSVSNACKHNLKKKYHDNLAGSWYLQDYYWYLLIFLTHLFIYLLIHLFIYLFIHLLFIYLLIYFLLTYFSFSFIQSFVFNFYVTYLPFPLSRLTVCFILFIMHPFRYLAMFLTCSYLCYNIID